MTKPVLLFLLGCSSGSVVILPHVKWGPIPITYVTCALLFALGLLLLPKTRRRYSLSFLWLSAPAAYIALLGVFMDGIDPSQVLARNLSALLAGLILICFVRDRRSLQAALLGLSVPVLMNVSAALAQSFDFGGLGSFVAGMADMVGQDDDEDISDVAGFRIYGLQGKAHVFAYNMALIGVMFLLAVPYIHSRMARTLCLSTALLCGFAVFLSAQRSAFWPLVFAYAVLGATMLLQRGHRGKLVAGSALAIAVGFLFYFSGNISESNSAVARLYTGFGEQGGDFVRAASWSAAEDVIFMDPWFGRAFFHYAQGIGIHNAFLGGWARFGVFWLISFLAIVSLHLIRLARQIPVYLKIGEVCILGLLAGNYFFHSQIPTFNDMIFYISLAFVPAVAYAVHRESNA